MRCWPEQQYGVFKSPALPHHYNLHDALMSTEHISNKRYENDLFCAIFLCYFQPSLPSPAKYPNVNAAQEMFTLLHLFQWIVFFHLTFYPNCFFRKLNKIPHIIWV